MILAYQIHSSVAGIYDVLDKLRLFAVSVGWTQAEWRTGERWNQVSPYGWQGVADSNCAYLRLTSTGQGGTQNLIAHLHIANYLPSSVARGGVTGYDPNDYRLMVDMGTTGIYDPAPTQAKYPGYQDTSNFYLPMVSYSYCAASGLSMPTGTIQKLWLFGNSQWICAALRIDGVYHAFLHFGSLEMFDSAPTEGEFWGRQYPVASLNYAWDNYVNLTDPTTTPYNAFTFYGTGVGGYYRDRSCILNIGGSASRNISGSLDIGKINDYQVSPIFNYSGLMSANSYSGRRFMMKQIKTYVRDIDGLTEPIGQTPYYLLNFTGLTPGEILTYGTEQYIVLPVFAVGSVAGVAFRIA